MEKFGQYFIDGEVKSSDGAHRLLTLLEAVGTDGNSFDFHKLLWQRRDGESWVDVLSVTKESFQGKHPLQRWVSRVHSIDPESGRAIISVAENDLPEGSKRVHCYYTWREWDLKNNKEIAVLKKCDRPFDPFEDEPNGS